MSDLTDKLGYWAQRQPNAAAVEAGDTGITYAELDRASSALAGTLRSLGVRPGDRVAIWLRKSVEAIVAIYGVLKSGAAYVPIDPGAPFGRAARMMAGCAVSCVIADHDCVPQLLGDRCPVIAVGADMATDTGVTTWLDALLGSPTATTDTGPDGPAYILYTSGSTGVPKGVTVSHRNALAFVSWAAEEFGMRPGDRVASHAPLHFDLSILDIFAAGMAGGCVCLVPTSHTGLGAALNKFVVERRISVWYSVPNALTRMLAAGNASLLAGSALRVVLFAGEVFPQHRLRQLSALLPDALLYNLYGPTETNVCTFHQVRAADVAAHRTEPVVIGKRCPYAITYLLDPDGQPIDEHPGASGELCVGGDSVMLGYWQDPDLTAARTVLVRDGDSPPVAAYRTGDLVRLDGELDYVFCGRADDMVKVRGYRVEPGEIESVLAAASGVQEAVCVAVDVDGEKHLEAFLVPDSDVCDIDRIRRRCRDQLPRYMVPERFHVVASLPRTSTGKIDRRSLAGS